MIRRLRKRFIRIAMTASTVVMLSLSLIVNAAHFVSVNSDRTRVLDMICENKGTIPAPIPPGLLDKEGADEWDMLWREPNEGHGRRHGPFNSETPYATRYFSLWFDGNGSLINADLEHIAAITEDEVNEYLAVAREHGSGYGYYSGFKYRVVPHGEDRLMAVFLDCYQEFRMVRIVAACSLLAVAACVTVIYVLVVFLSKKAIDPVVRSAERQKQFITDASHELKTPVTVIATCLKVLEMEVGEHKWIDKSKAQTERLKNLVDSLVTLSRMDEEGSPLRFERFAVSDAVRETAESFVDFAASQGHELRMEIEPDVEYVGDEYAVRQLVSILLDNAVKYAVRGSPVAFSLKQEKNGIVMQTVNGCEKIDPEDVEKLFDRFYRADKSRNSNTGGFGIGLSVARGIAEGHKGSISARCPEENKIEFIVRLK